MQLSHLLLFSLVALASNSGSTSATKCSATITAKYDDLPQQPPASAPLPFGPYRGLKYTNFNLVTLGVLGSPPPTGVKAASNPNVIADSVFAPTSPSKSKVTVVGGGAGYKSFNPASIAYGCVVNTEETATGVPTTCTLALSGFKAGARVVRQLVTYEVANNEVSKAMYVASFQGFGGVDTVRFEVIVPSDNVVAFLLDDFKYAGCS